MSVRSGAAGGGSGGGSTLDYVARTSNLTVTSTSSASPTTVVTGATQVYDGNPVWVEFSCAQAALGTGSLFIGIYYDSTLVEYSRIDIGGSTPGVPVHMTLKHSPSAGSHTYSVGAWNGTGTTGMIYATSQYLSAHMRITRY